MGTLIAEHDANVKKALEAAQKDTYETVCIDEAEYLSPENYKEYCSIPNQKSVAERKKGKKIELKRAGLIADAVSQSVIVKIKLSRSPKSPEELPNITTWAFLQPPSIGGNKMRVNANNGYVIDDAQKAGWFLGEIKSTSAVPNGTNKYKATLFQTRDTLKENGDKGEPVTEEHPVSITVKDKEIFFKYTVTVRNDESESDLKEKREKLKKAGKKKDVLTFECGSYIKIWVRNSDYSWRDTEGPKDEFTEQLRKDMEAVDPRTDQNKPQSCKNHTWKRNSIVSGENTDQLLYIGLYPSTIIQKLNKIEEVVGAKDTNFGIWMGMSIGFATLSLALNQIKKQLAQRYYNKQSGNTTGRKTQAEYENTIGKYILIALRNLNVPQIAAAYAVTGFDHKLDVNKTVDAAKHTDHKTLSEVTNYVYNQLLEFTLANDEHGKKEHAKEIQASNNKVRSPYLAKEMGTMPTAQRLAHEVKYPDNFKSGLISMLESLKPASKDSVSTANMELDIASLTSATNFPSPTGAPLPIPFLQWIVWYIQTKFTGTCKLTVEGEYTNKKEDASKKQKEEHKLKFTTGLSGTAGAQITFNLQALWAVMMETSADGSNIKNPNDVSNSFLWG